MAKDFKLMGEAYLQIRKNLSAPSTEVIAEAGGTATGSANVAKMQQQAQQPAPVTSAGVAAAGGEGPGATAVDSTKTKTDFDAAATAYFKSMGVTDAQIKTFLDSTHAQLNGFKGPQAASGTQQYMPQGAQQPAAAAAPNMLAQAGQREINKPAWASR
jgi:hypothetical protein